MINNASIGGGGIQWLFVSHRWAPCLCFDIDMGEGRSSGCSGLWFVSERRFLLLNKSKNAPPSSDLLLNGWLCLGSGQWVFQVWLIYAGLFSEKLYRFLILGLRAGLSLQLAATSLQALLERCIFDQTGSIFDVCFCLPRPDFFL